MAYILLVAVEGIITKENQKGKLIMLLPDTTDLINNNKPSQTGSNKL